MQRRWFLYAILAAWLALFVYSFYAVAGVEPTGDGFVRGMNRVSLFLRWHLSAVAFAIAAAFVGWRAQSRVRRRVSKAPVAVHVILIVSVFGKAWLDYNQEKTSQPVSDITQDVEKTTGPTPEKTPPTAAD